MNARWKWIYGILLFLTPFSFCRKEVNGPQESELIGSWEWKKSIGGFGGWVITSDSVGTTYRLDFLLPNTFQFYENGSLLARGQFTLLAEGEQWKIIYNRKFHLSPVTREQFLQFAGNDTLILTDNCMDCYRHTFVRIR